MLSIRNLACISNGFISKCVNCFKGGREITEDDKFTGRQKR